MKMKLLFCALITLSLLNCGNDDDENTTNPQSFDYELFNNSEIVISEFETFGFLSIESGTQTVFKYRFTAEDDINIADDEYAEILHFEVGSDLNSFSYANEELLDLQMYIRRSCFCASIPLIPISEGTVSGTKQSDGSWQISMTITFEWDDQSETVTQDISGVFQEQ